VNPAIAGNPRDLHHGHGPYLFLELTPRLRGGLGQSQELVLQRLIGLWITAVARQILVNGLRAGFRSCAEGGLVGHRMGVASF